jgi:hypothetical protein
MGYILKASNAGGISTVTRYVDMLAGNAGTPVITDFGAMFPIAMVNLSSATPAITFNSIPQTYKHLQLRYSARAGRSADAAGFLWLNINGSVSTRFHALYGTGSVADAYDPGVSNPSNNYGYQLQAPGSSADSRIFGGGVVDILDYASTTKNKTVRTLTGVDTNGAGLISLGSMLFASTNAVTSISIGSIDGFNTPAGARVSLYGILG